MPLLGGVAGRLGDGSSWRDIAAAVAVLTLATTGISGAVASTLMIVFVALSNVFTCKLLLQGAVATGAADYEQLAHNVGGRWLRLWSEVWVVVLLVGTNIGAIIQMGEAFGFAVETQWPDAPTWLYGRSGTAAMLFFTLVIIFPLSMLPKMRKLEMVGNFGVVILFALAIIVAVKAISNGMPALSSGDFASVSSGDLTSISETFSLLCFAFYHQVMMMPMLSEMPRVSSDAARESARALHRASTIVILGTSGMYYWVTGFFGASMYGATDVSDNLLGNTWLPGAGTFVLNLIVTIYLSISIPPIFQATNHTVDSWLRGLFPRNYGGLTRPWVQRFIVNLITILTCLGVALGVPGESATVLSVTGATGVAMCSYVLPVVFHFCLYFGWARCMRKTASSAQLSANGGLAGVEAGAAPTVEVSGMGLAPPTEGSTESSEAYKDFSNHGAPASPSKQVDGSPKHEPAPDAPAGLMFRYRKPRRYPFFTLAYDIVLPCLVTALGCFFSVATLVLLFQPVAEE